MKIYKKTSNRGVRQTEPRVRFQFANNKVIFNRIAMDKMGLYKDQGIYVGTENQRLYIVIPSSQEPAGTFTLRSNNRHLEFSSCDMISKVMFDMEWAKNGKPSMLLDVGDPEAFAEGVKYRLTPIK